MCLAVVVVLAVVVFVSVYVHIGVNGVGRYTVCKSLHLAFV